MSGAPGSLTGLNTPNHKNISVADHPMLRLVPLVCFGFGDAAELKHQLERARRQVASVPFERIDALSQSHETPGTACR